MKKIANQRAICSTDTETQVKKDPLNNLKLSILNMSFNYKDAEKLIQTQNLKKLRLKFEFIDSSLLSSDLFVSKIEANAKLNELINLLFDLLSKFDSNLILKNNFSNHISYDYSNNNFSILDYLLKYEGKTFSFF